jgi:hypothetical protein
MREPSRAPAAADLLYPELVGSPEPAPAARRHGSRVLRALARLALWSLIAAGALRGLVPALDRPAMERPATERPAAERPGPGPAAVEPSGDRRAEAVAAAFLREYLTVGDDRAARAERLRRFAAAGVDLGGSVSVPDGVAQYADQLVVAGSSPVAGGIEVTSSPTSSRSGRAPTVTAGPWRSSCPWPRGGRGSPSPAGPDPPPSRSPLGRRRRAPDQRRRRCRGWPEVWPARRWPP